MSWISFDLSRLPQRGQAFQQGLDRGGASAGEVAGDLFGRGLPHLLQRGADGGDLVWQARGPGGFGGRGNAAHVEFGLFALGGRMACGVLVVGAQPADQPACFLGRPSAVQGDKVLQNLIIDQGDGPAIGIGHGGVDLVVQVAQDADQALIVNLAVLALDPLARAEFLQHVIHTSQGQLGIFRLPRLAMRVEVFAKRAQVGGLGGGGGWEGVEAARFVVAGIVAIAEAAKPSA